MEKHAAVFAADRALCKERELETWNACLYKENLDEHCSERKISEKS